MAQWVVTAICQSVFPIGFPTLNWVAALLKAGQRRHD
jgi:hypothetical protein